MIGAIAMALMVVVIAGPRPRVRRLVRPGSGAGSGRRIEERLARAGVRAPRRPLVSWSALVACGAALGLAVLGAVGVLAGAVTAAIAPVVWIRRGEARADLAAEAQLPSLLEQLARSARGGATLSQGFADAAAALPAPLGRELTQVVTMHDQGVPLVRAVDAWLDPRGFDDGWVLSGALRLSDRLGGANAGAFDTFAAALRRRADARAEARALAGQAVASAAVIGVAPVAFALVLAATGTSQLEVVLATPAGRLSAAFGVVLEAVGVVWMRRIVQS